MLSCQRTNFAECRYTFVKKGKLCVRRYHSGSFSALRGVSHRGRNHPPSKKLRLAELKDACLPFVVHDDLFNLSKQLYTYAD